MRRPRPEQSAACLLPHGQGATGVSAPKPTVSGPQLHRLGPTQFTPRRACSPEGLCSHVSVPRDARQAGSAQSTRVCNSFLLEGTHVFLAKRVGRGWGLGQLCPQLANQEVPTSQLAPTPQPGPPPHSRGPAAAHICLPGSERPSPCRAPPGLRGPELASRIRNGHLCCCLSPTARPGPAWLLSCRRTCAGFSERAHEPHHRLFSQSRTPLTTPPPPSPSPPPPSSRGLSSILHLGVGRDLQREQPGPDQTRPGPSLVQMSYHP